MEASEGLDNMEVGDVLQFRVFVREQFAWRHHYWYLTNEGTRYLCDFLHLPSEIVPATMKYKKPTAEAASRPTTTRSRMRDGGEGDRGAYRKAAGEADKVGDAGAGSAPVEFRGGYGRGGKPA